MSISQIQRKSCEQKNNYFIQFIIIRVDFIFLFFNALLTNLSYLKKKNAVQLLTFSSLNIIYNLTELS